MKFNRIIQGDCVEAMNDFPECSIDCIVTDPPYGISFMGKSWDQALPPKEAFMEMFRVLKHGALAFVMSSPRQDVLWRMLAMLEDVGFQLKQSPIFWTYASGFPKAYDVSLGIDRKFIREEFIEEHGRKPSKEEMKALMEEKRVKTDQLKQGHSLRRHRTFGTDGIGIYHDAKESFVYENIPYSPLAKKWSGWKSQTGLKPAVECILMVNKPFSEKTIVDNVLKHGTGAINVDEARIPYTNNKDKEEAIPQGRITTRVGSFAGRTQKGIDREINREEWKNSMKGRFPANLTVSSDVLDTGKITVSKYGKDTGKGKSWFNTGFGNQGDSDMYRGDKGDFSRFFSLDAWWRERVKRLPREVRKTFPFLAVPKASKSEREQGCENLPLRESDRTNQNWRCILCGKFQLSGDGNICKCETPNWFKPKNTNFHPTVKPLQLMSYLITLGCPHNGVVLDPFVGSGSTCIAAKMLGYKYVGIEINVEYCMIAEARLKAVPETLTGFN